MTNHQNQHNYLWNYETNKGIRFGHGVSLKTDDPVNHPLPDFDLLDMQWILNCVTAVTGAAKFEDEFGGSDSGNDNDLPIALQDKLSFYSKEMFWIWV